MVISNSKKATKAQHRIGNASALLVDHDALDEADLGVVGAEYCGSFHLVAPDQGARFSLFHRHPLASFAARNSTGGTRDSSGDAVSALQAQELRRARRFIPKPESSVRHRDGAG